MILYIFSILFLVFFPFHSSDSSFFDFAVSDPSTLRGRDLVSSVDRGFYDIDDYNVELVDMKPINGGLEVFLRAWDSSGQIGFGDGTVDIERFRIKNPPLYYPDDSGSYVREVRDPYTNEVVEVRRYRVDPESAFFATIKWGIDNKKQRFSSDEIVRGRVGNTTLIFYPEAGDGLVQHDGAVWSTVRNASSGSTVVDDSDTLFIVGTGINSSGNYRVIRGFFPYDSSGYAGTIDSVQMGVFVTAITNDDNDGDDWLNVFLGSQSSVSELSFDDYDECGSTEGATRIDLGSIVDDSLNTWTFNSTGESWVNFSGVTKICMREGHDVLDIPFSGSTDTFNRIFLLGSESTSDDPRLIVEYTAGGDPDPDPEPSLDECPSDLDSFSGLLQCVSPGGDFVLMKNLGPI